MWLSWVCRDPGWLPSRMAAPTLLLSGLPDPSTHRAHPSRPQQEVKKSLCDTYLQWTWGLEAATASHNWVSLPCLSVLLNLDVPGDGSFTCSTLVLIEAFALLLVRWCPPVTYCRWLTAPLWHQWVRRSCVRKGNISTAWADKQYKLLWKIITGAKL